jgi:hypothetical protein
MRYKWYGRDVMSQKDAEQMDTKLNRLLCINFTDPLKVILFTRPANQPLFPDPPLVIVSSDWTRLRNTSDGPMQGGLCWKLTGLSASIPNRNRALKKQVQMGKGGKKGK